MSATVPASDSDARPVKSRRGWHPWRWLFASLAAALLLVLVLAGWLVATQSGLRALVDFADDLAAEAFSIGRVDGRLIRGIRARDLRLSLTGLEVRIGTLDLDWRADRLLGGTLSIVDLQARDVVVLLAETQEPKSDEPLRLPEIQLPVAVEVDRLQIDQLRLGMKNQPDSPLMVLTRAELVGAARRFGVDVRELRVDLAVPEVIASAKGRVELRGDYPLDLGLDWTFSQAPALTVRGQGRLSGDLRQLRVEHQISGSVDLTLNAELRDLLAAPGWQATAELASVNLPQIVVGAPRVDLTARLKSEGTLKQATLTGKLAAVAPGHDEMGAVSADLDLGWADQRLSVNALDLTEAGSGAMLDLHGDLDLAAPTGRVDLSGVWQKLRWPLTGVAQFESPRGTLDAKGQLDNFTYKLTGTVFGQGIPEANLSLSGDGDQQGARIEELLLDALDGHAVGKGRVNWAPTLGWDLALTAREFDPGLQWPGTGGRVGLKAESKGSLADGYQYQLKADLALKEYPSLVLNLAGEGTATAVKLDSLTLESLGGRVTGEGSLNWVPEPGWDLDLQIADIDPGRHYPDWTGHLSGAISSTGRLADQNPELQASIHDFGGELRGYPVKLAGLFEMAGSTIKVPELQLSSGSTRLTASGSMADQLAFDFRLNSPNLGELLPQAAGRLELGGRLSGSARAPRLSFSIDGQNIAVEQQQIATLKGDADLGLGPGDPIRAALTGSKLLLGGMAFKQLDLKAQGSLPDHRVTAELTGEPLSVRLALAGKQQPAQGYQASLDVLRITTARFGNWSLPRQAPLALNQGRIQVGPLCLSERQGSNGCIQFDQTQPGLFDASLKLDRVSFDLVDGLLPPNLDLKGHLTADAAFKARDAAITGQASVRVPEGRLELSTPGGDEPLQFSDTGLDLVANPSGVEVKLKVPVENLGRLDGQAVLPGFVLHAPVIDTQPLRGRVTLELTGLNRIANLLPDVSETSGTAAADFKLGGMLKSPTIEGQARLQDLGLKVPMLGLNVSEVNLDARTRGSDRLELSGGANIGGGKLALSGNGLRGDLGWTLEFQISGDQLKVANSKEYFVLLQTDLRGGIGPGGGSLQGNVMVKEARIMPRSIPAGTLGNSPDVVIAGQGSSSSQGAQSPFHVDVEIALSDSVLIEAFGLRGYLRGKLRALEEPHQPLVGEGQLRIVDGTYRLSSQFGVMASIGAALKIEQGILVFAKTPLTNPGLVMQAQREDGGMTAGVTVTGTLKNPTLGFFSESDPNMTDGEIVNYLLTGIPPKGDGSNVDRSLSLGTYIAPNLFLEYDTSLGAESDKIKLRYDVNSWLEIQTETGQAQGADVFFKFEN